MPTLDYTLTTLVEELRIYTMLQGTPYTALSTSLLAHDKLSIAKVEDAIKNEELCVSGASQVAAASVANSSHFSGSSSGSASHH